GHAHRVHRRARRRGGLGLRPARYLTCFERLRRRWVNRRSSGVPASTAATPRATGNIGRPPPLDARAAGAVVLAAVVDSVRASVVAVRWATSAGVISLPTAAPFGSEKPQSSS